MKNTIINKFIFYTGLWLMNIVPAWAADAGREDNSDLFVWVFLGFCALIVVAQLIPALFILFGFAKGVKKVKETPMTPTPETLDTLTPHEGGRN